jgi:hypothetical protein
MSDTRPTPLSGDERRELERLRTEVVELRTQASSDPAPVSPRRRHRLRSVGGVLVITLGCLLAPLSVVSVWLESQVTDTDAYVETVAPLIEDPAVQDALATAVTSEVFRQLDIQNTTTEALQALVDRTDLPPLVEERLVGLAVPLANGVEGLVTEQVDQLVASEDFETAWVEANRVAHEELVATLTGQQDGAVQVEEGTVSVNIAPFVDVVKQRLIDRGLTVAERIPDVQASFVVMQSADLARAQSLFALLDTLGTVFPFLVIAVLAAGVLIAVDRRRALVGAGLGVAGAMVLLGVLLALLRGGYLSAVPTDLLPRDAAAVIFDTLVRFLRTALRSVLLLGLVVAVAAYLAGPSRSALRTRAVAGRGMAAVRRLGAGSEGLAGVRVGHAVRSARRPMQVLAVTVAGVTLVFWDRPTPAVLIGVVLVLLLVLAVIEALAASGDYPSATSGDYPPASGTASLETDAGAPALPPGSDTSELPDQRAATTDAERAHTSA